MRDSILHRFIITGFLLSVLAIAACGVKGPPVPPDKRPHLPAAALAYRVAGEQVVLTWHLPERLEGPLAQEAAFDIYRSRTSVSQPACETCPLVFEKVASVPYRHTDDDRLSATLALDAGYRYAYTVRLSARGADGADSNTVRFTFAPGDEPSTTEAP